MSLCADLITSTTSMTESQMSPGTCDHHCKKQWIVLRNRELSTLLRQAPRILGIEGQSGEEEMECQ